MSIAGRARNRDRELVAPKHGASKCSASHFCVCVCVCVSVQAFVSAGAQTWYPPAVAGDRVASNDAEFVAMAIYTTQTVLANHQGELDAAAAARIVGGLKLDWGDDAANFDYQLELVRLALRASMLAPDAIRPQVDATLSEGLLSYWNGQEVGPSPGGDETAQSILFVDLGQAIIRTAQAGDPAAAAAVKSIWMTYGLHHPLAKDPRLTTYLSRAVTESEYADFVQASVEALASTESSATVSFDATDISPAEFVIFQITPEVQTAALVELGSPASTAATTASSNGCISNCIASLGCNSQPWYTRWACKSTCVAACAAAAVMEHLDESHGLDL